MIHDPTDVKRYTAFERANHWIVAIFFVSAALSGLTFFHPVFWPFNQLFGGGTWTRILHPYIGLLLFIAFAFMFVRFRTLNRMTPVDWAWVKRIGEVMAGNDRNMPAQGKYNGGQKLMFWTTTLCLLVMLLSGVVMWRAFFNFPVMAVRLAAVIHATAGTLIIALILGHIYMAIWTTGTIRAMIYGTVTRAWARQRHETWYRQTVGN